MRDLFLVCRKKDGRLFPIIAFDTEEMAMQYIEDNPSDYYAYEIESIFYYPTY